MQDEPYSQIRDLLADDPNPDEIATHRVDLEVSRGEYDSCSTELELAYNDY